MSWQEPLGGLRSRIRFAGRHTGSWQRVSPVAEDYFAHKWVNTSTSRDEGAPW